MPFSQGQVLFVSAGCAAGAAYGFYLVDSLERKRKEALAKSPPSTVSNLPEHLRPALEGQKVETGTTAPDRGAKGGS